MGLLPHRHPRPHPQPSESPQPAAGLLPAPPSLAPAPSGRPALAGSTGHGPTAALPGGRWVGEPFPLLSWGGQGTRSELRLPLIPRPYSPSREENDQILIQEKAPAASPGTAGALHSRASQGSCLRSVDPRRSVSASDLSQLIPVPALAQAACAGPSPRGCFGFSPRLPRVGAGAHSLPAEHSAMLLTAQRWTWHSLGEGPAPSHWSKPTFGPLSWLPGDFTQRGGFSLLGGH